MSTVLPMFVSTLPDLDATRELARKLAADLRPGDVVLLDGPLGAGKTTLTKAIVAALAGEAALVASPTFTLLHQYQSTPPVVHVDAYRLAGPSDLDGLGFAEASAEAVALIEWGERVAAAFAGHGALWHIRLGHAGDDKRTVEIEAPARCAAAWAPVAEAAAAAVELVAASPSAVATVAAADAQVVTISDTPATAPGVLEPAPQSIVIDGTPAVAITPSTPTAPAIITIPLDAQGTDPLTRAYLAEHRLTCAARTLSWKMLLLCLVLAVATGALACWLDGVEGHPFLPPKLERLPSGEFAPFLSPKIFNWQAFATGLALCATVCSLAGSLVRAVRPQVLPVAQEAWIAAGVVGVAYLAILDPLVGLSVFTLLLCAVYLGAIAFRLFALLIGGRRGHRAEQPAEPVGGWPLYTVLVPLYREKAVARNILRALDQLDYPRDRLDVKFLLEADDPDTLPALQAAGIPPWAEVVVVPHAQPKTKPRACNHGLLRARGEFLVIFDAEDRPEPDQLKQAVAAFATVPARVVCLQAQLAYHNHRQNLLTRWFAMEYNVWFRRYLPGLARLGVPIPLGGTSNHFRTAELKAVGGWDPFNVTEDCDLGVRLHLRGHRTALLDSTTWEEANSVTGNWLRQRSRWLKGYFVTHVVWCRRPLWLLVRLNPWALGGFLLSVLLVPLLAAANLVLWCYLLVYSTLVAIDLAHGHALWTILAERDFGDQRLSWPMWFAGPAENPLFSQISQVFFIASVALLLGNLAFIVIAGLSGRRPGQRGVWPAALLMPAYWVLISLAAWKGLWQAMVKPHYWEKTIHGLDHAAEPVAPVESPKPPVA